MGRLFVVDVEGRCYSCRFCDTPLALADDVLSRTFNCRKGRAYLFSNVVNITVGPPEERMMLSGMHTVEDIYCCSCGQLLGWKYHMTKAKNTRKESLFLKDGG
ncbi:protein yippee-like At5g53940 isoform X3 [Ricinus communis]|uniref:protein yippee-like At5g53940 isoform X3 n=1 Tax=Ricinus communis TaxID=3988 RepID=UPI0007723934|nr:protein yippee-like At5g53940 isoform X3 [Ricinus communis]|eukprot:XP_015572156.1 protein yippee-like At5g53940 isoform X2 [Ricinus communis]